MIGLADMEDTNNIIDIAVIERHAGIFRLEQSWPLESRSVFDIQTIDLIAGNHNILDRDIF